MVTRSYSSGRHTDRRGGSVRPTGESDLVAAVDSELDLAVPIDLYGRSRFVDETEHAAAADLERYGGP